MCFPRKDGHAQELCDVVPGIWSALPGNFQALPHKRPKTPGIREGLRPPPLTHAPTYPDFLRNLQHSPQNAKTH